MTTKPPVTIDMPNLDAADAQWNVRISRSEKGVFSISGMIPGTPLTFTDPATDKDAAKENGYKGPWHNDVNVIAQALIEALAEHATLEVR